MFISNLSPEIKVSSWRCDRPCCLPLTCFGSQNPVQEQFLETPLKLREYIRRMQKWHDRYERALDARPNKEPLDFGPCLLSDFHHSKFDDVEVPGQYIEHVDSNADFAKIG